jgi:hypothetical protein
MRGKTHRAEPDGRWIAFVASASVNARALFLRPIGSTTARQLTATDGNNITLFWSADSRYIGFVSEGKLKKIDVAGGPAQSLCELPIKRRLGRDMDCLHFQRDRKERNLRSAVSGRCREVAGLDKRWNFSEVAPGREGIVFPERRYCRENDGCRYRRFRVIDAAGYSSRAFRLRVLQSGPWCWRSLSAVRRLRGWPAIPDSPLCRRNRRRHLHSNHRRRQLDRIPAKIASSRLSYKCETRIPETL